MKISKTNAMRILDKEKIAYECFSYDASDDKIDGISVAEKIGQDKSQVYKTLVTTGSDKQIYVCVIPVEDEIDFKKAAKAFGVKSLEMINVKDINKHTGYIRGGCSPVGMKKLYKTVIDDSANSLDHIIVSGGKIGVQIKLKVEDLAKVVDAKLESVTK